MLPSSEYNYSAPSLPSHFNNQNVLGLDTEPANNRVTDAGATLGRVLFYDKLLSANNQISCSSCHEQGRGFSDGNRLSIGFLGGRTPRHSMGLSNARYYGPDRFFWDERAASLEAQVLLPIQDPVEMGETLQNVVSKIQATSYYPGLFDAAFGSPQISSDRVANALAQFIRSMVSYRSKFDVGVTNGFANFSTQEELGRQLFNSRRTNCSACHATNLQILDRARNTGLDAVTTDVGAGDGRFKSPSLRNVAVRPPFMHDGRFTTLNEVVSFYNSGVQNHPNLDNRLRNNGQPIRMNLSAAEQLALVAFLQTLTDPSFLVAQEFSDPFQEIAKVNVLSGVMSLLLSDDE